MKQITGTGLNIMVGCVTSLALLVPLTAAQAGGLAVREQSTQFQGSSFAGNGAGGALSSSFWNSAAMGEAGEGLSSESNVTAIFSSSKFTVLDGSSAALTVGDTAHASTPAVLSSSYTAYRLNDKIVLGMAINSPFGVSTELDNPTGSFSLYHRSASILTLNANPMASVEVMPGLFVGVGAQIQYFRAKFKTDSGNLFPASGDTTGIKGDDIGFGYTAGLLWKPGEETSIGIGFRSAIDHKVEGDQFVLGAVDVSVPFELDVTTPEMVTVSARHEVVDGLTMLGTLEWTNWDRLGIIPIRSVLPDSALDFQWHDGWFFSLGAEYEYSEHLTLRTGAAYEISPVQNDTERLVQVPDADRFWLSAGGTYELTDSIELDFAFTHVFVKDSNLSRVPANPALAAVNLEASAETNVNIFSVGFKMALGGSEDSSDDE